LQGLRAELIGRGVEMALLEGAVERLRDGKASIIAVCGEAGTGKSRLIEEFQAGLPEGQYTWLTSHAHEHAQGIPYSPVIDLLNRAWGIVEDDTPSRVREKIETGIRSLLQAPDAAIPYVGNLYALDYPALRGISPEYWARRLYEVSLALFEAMAVASPMVFCFEDLHWADPSTMELLRHVWTHFRQPAITLCTYRPPFRLFVQEDAGDVPGYREIELEPLAATQTEELVQTLLQGGSVPPELIGFVQEKAGGNPFYVEEVLTSLIESGALVQANGHWRLVELLQGFHIPSTVQGVIAARVDRLERHDRSLLQEASVIGRTFHHQVLGQATAFAEHLDDRLSTLEQTDLIRMLTLEPDLEYMFKHALTQEVVYNSLLRSDREAIHERVGNAMEHLLADRLPEFYETLAFHYKQGRSLHKAVDYLMKSGEKSVNRFALDEAHQYYREAYDLLSAKPDKTEADIGLLFDLLEQWAIVFYYFGTFDDLVQLLRRHEPLVKTLQDKARQGMFAAWMGWALFFKQRTQEAHRYLLQALALGEEAANPYVIAYACTWLAGSYAILNQFSNGIAHGERAQELALTMPENHFLYFKSMGMTGLNYSFMGEAMKTREMGRQLMEYGERTGNPRSFMFGSWLLADGCANAGDFPSAMAYSEKGLHALKDPFYLMHARAIHGMKCVFNGRVDSMLEEAVHLARSQGSTFLVNWWGAFLGLGRIMGGRMAEGMKLIEEAARESLENEDTAIQQLNELIKGKVYLQMVIGTRPPPTVMLKNLGFLLTHLPFAARRAATLLGNAAHFYGENGAYGFRAQVLLDLAKLHPAKKRKEKALACLTEAEPLFEKAGAEVFLQQTRDLLAALQ
jgi:predicted ATPase